MTACRCQFCNDPLEPAQELRYLVELQNLDDPTYLARIRRLQSHVEELEEQVRSVVPEADLQTQEAVVQQALEVAFKARGLESRTGLHAV